MSYQWIHPPLKLVEDYDETLPRDLQVVQDDLNQHSVVLRAEDVPEEDWKLYNVDADTVRRSKRQQEQGDDPVDVEEHYGFWIARDADLSDPRASEVFAAFNDWEVYLPIGQHAQGSYHPGDWLISIEDYEAISRGLYTPATYTCDMVRQWDPHKMLRPRKETV